MEHYYLYTKETGINYLFSGFHQMNYALIKANENNMNSKALDRPNQAERTAEQTPRVNGRGIYQALLFIFSVVCF